MLFDGGLGFRVLAGLGYELRLMLFDGSFSMLKLQGLGFSARGLCGVFGIYDLVSRA